MFEVLDISDHNYR